MLELKRGAAPMQVQTEMIQFIALPFPSSKKLTIWSFHVIVVQGRQRNVQRSVITCRVVVFLTAIAFWRFHCRRRCSFLRSLISPHRHTPILIRYRLFQSKKCLSPFPKATSQSSTGSTHPLSSKSTIRLHLT